MDGDWPRPCWDGYWSGHLPPTAASPDPSRASDQPTVASELTSWIPTRNGLVVWEDGNREDFEHVARELDTWMEWLTTKLSSVEEGVSEFTFAADELSDFVETIREFLRLNGEHVVRLSRVVTVTDDMLHALGWTESKGSG